MAEARFYLLETLKKNLYLLYLILSIIKAFYLCSCIAKAKVNCKSWKEDPTKRTAEGLEVERLSIAAIHHSQQATNNRTGV